MADDPKARVRLDHVVPQDGSIDCQELIDLYRLAVDDVRFQVTLNWQRTQYYFTINTAILAAAAAILRVSGSVSTLVVTLLFGIGFVTARLGRRMIAQGHSYYRRAFTRRR